MGAFLSKPRRNNPCLMMSLVPAVPCSLRKTGRGLAGGARLEALLSPTDKGPWLE